MNNKRKMKKKKRKENRPSSTTAKEIIDEVRIINRFKTDGETIDEKVVTGLMALFL
jgi:ribosomal protein S18